MLTIVIAGAGAAPQQESVAFQLISTLIQKKVKGTWWRSVPLTAHRQLFIFNSLGIMTAGPHRDGGQPPPKPPKALHLHP